MGCEKSDRKERRGECCKDKKLQDRDLRDLVPETDDESSRTPDDQEPTNYLAPANIALLHERQQNLAEWAGWFGGLLHRSRGTSRCIISLFIDRLELRFICRPLIRGRGSFLAGPLLSNFR